LIKFTIQGSLPSLNEYVNANRRNRYAGAKMKQDTDKLISYYIKAQVTEKLKGEFILIVDWYEKDSRKDADNVTFAQKFILDSLQHCGVIPNDNRKYLNEIHHHVYVDKENPRVEVQLISV
jgi:Holliday junction resolvase RusA-like endonuclease